MSYGQLFLMVRGFFIRQCKIWVELEFFYAMKALMSIKKKKVKYDYFKLLYWQNI